MAILLKFCWGDDARAPEAIGAAWSWSHCVLRSAVSEWRSSPWTRLSTTHGFGQPFRRRGTRQVWLQIFNSNCAIPILTGFLCTTGQSSLPVAPSDISTHQSGAQRLDTPLAPSASAGESSQNVWHPKMRTTSCICVFEGTT